MNKNKYIKVFVKKYRKKIRMILINNLDAENLTR